MATAEMTRTDGAKRAGQGISKEFANDAGRLKETMKERARQEAETRKDEATKAAKATSSALDKAAGDLKQDKDAPQWLASAFQTTAGKIEKFAGDIEQRSPDQIGRDVSRFASQNPAAFLAASAAAGFAAARFLSAGAEYQKDHQGGGAADPNAYTGSGAAPLTSRDKRFGGAEGGTIL